MTVPDDEFMTSTLTTANTRAILLDIEGTVTPIAFVHEVLFPYASSHVRDYLASHFESTEVESDLTRLREEHSADVEQHQEPPELVTGPRDIELDSIVAYVHWLMKQDRKSTALKSLQGKIWKEGYRDGTLQALLFADVLPALQRWRNTGLKISIFSSGSSFAQQLLFAHTDAGDLTGFIDNYFDTTVGPKLAGDSYQNIASSLNFHAQDILFISDVVGELDAASEAGMQTLLCIRPGNPPQPDPQRHRIIHTFDQL